MELFLHSVHIFIAWYLIKQRHNLNFTFDYTDRNALPYRYRYNVLDVDGGDVNSCIPGRKTSIFEGCTYIVPMKSEETRRARGTVPCIETQ
jgi:hypothetical protein